MGLWFTQWPAVHSFLDTKLENKAKNKIARNAYTKAMKMIHGGVSFIQLFLWVFLSLASFVAFCIMYIIRVSVIVVIPSVRSLHYGNVQFLLFFFILRSTNS